MQKQIASQWAMCLPQYFGVEYVINPWMEGHIGQAKADVAAAQWQKLYELVAAHTSVALIPPVSDLPDMPFVANAGLVLNDIFIPSVFRFPQRRLEECHFIEWFQQQGYKIVELGVDGTFEGEGDALFQPGQPLLWAGYGVRSSLEVHRRLCEILDVEVVSLYLVDKRFYHLDTCFSPLPGGRVLYYPPAFDDASLKAIADRIPASHRLEVSDEDALNFTCNGVVLDDVFICNHPTAEFVQKMQAWGFKVLETPLTEFMLAGGAAKCLSLRLTQTVPARTAATSAFKSTIVDCLIELQGHLLDDGKINQVLDLIMHFGGSFEIPRFQAGLRQDQESLIQLRIFAPNAQRLHDLIAALQNKTKASQLIVRISDV
ncbi:MAG: arginine deiminase-related protein [Gammaproteobacteria bacterium]